MRVFVNVCVDVDVTSDVHRGNQRVKANTIYQEVVADRNHIHMNSTIWSTLGNFVQYLGKTNKAVVDQTPKGTRARTDVALCTAAHRSRLLSSLPSTPPRVSLSLCVCVVLFSVSLSPRRLVRAVH